MPMCGVTFSGRVLGENGGAGIALFLRAVPVRRVSRGPELLDVVGAAFGFLQAKHVGFLGVEVIEKILLQHGAQAVDVPGNQFHARQHKPRMNVDKHGFAFSS